MYRNEPPTERAERLRLEQLRADFASAHGVKPYRNRRFNVLRLLRSSGAPEASVRDVLDSLGHWGAHRGAFDHAELWGAHGRPSILIGHPYALSSDSRAVLEAIAALGLEVKADGQSFYGHNTLQVAVFARPPALIDELDRRGGCRYGLNGVQLRHIPTGRDFDCGGSMWDRDGALQIISGVGPAGAQWTPATECLLIGKWPIVCCRPSSRATYRSQAAAHEGGGE